MYGADIWVIQSGSGACFALKAFENLRIAKDVFGKKFQCDKAAKLRVLGFVDDTHPATAELFENAVLRNELTLHIWANEMLFT